MSTSTLLPIPGPVTTLLTYLLAGSLLFYLVTAIYSFYRPGLRELPGPPLAAFSRLWNVFNIAHGNAPQNFRKLHQRYGKIVRIGPNHVSIADPATIPVIYGINSSHLKSEFYASFDTPYEGQPMSSMFSARIPVEHKRLKSAVANKFSMTSLRDLETLMDECSDIFLKTMRELSGSPIDLGVWLQWYAFDVIGAITFQQRFGFMEQRKDVRDMIAGLEFGLWYGSLVGQIPELHPWMLGNPILNHVLATVPALNEFHPIPKFTNIVLGAIKKYDEGNGLDRTRGDFLAMFRQEQNKKADRMSERDLMNHLLNNLLAGSDTTAISLRAILYYIIKTPRVHQKLVQEIAVAAEEVRLSERITFDECNKLQYLQAVIKEAMRIHPGVGFPLERVISSQGAKLCDVDIPSGTIVGVNAWVIHQNQEIYGHDAHVFRPERWLEASPEQLKLMDRYFLSFGHGTRSCIGKNISIMEMGKLVPQILREFDMEWASEKDEWTVRTFWFAKQTDMIVRFRPRISAGLKEKV